MSRRSFLGATAGAGVGGVLVGGLGTGPAVAGTRSSAPYEPTPASLARHPTARWYREAKFGIFIHWGVYAVPAWGDANWSSEWYFYGMNAPGKPGIFDHHRDTYGTDFAYDEAAGPNTV